MMYPGLHITDLTPAAGETYYRNRSWCVEKEATLHPQPVNLFDYKHMLAKNSEADLPATFDLVVCFGLCFNVFGTAGEHLGSGGTNSTVSRQYSFLSHGSMSHQQIFNEALMGQDMSATHILIHQTNHAVVSPVPVSYGFAKARMYNPEGGRHVLDGGSCPEYPTLPNIEGPLLL